MAPVSRDGRTDVQLLRAAKTDADAFDVFFQRHAPRIERWFRRQVGNQEVALDLTAETFARALEAVGRFRPLTGESALPWLFGITAKLLQTYWRSERVDRTARERLRIADELAFVDGPEALVERPDATVTTAALREALEGLPENQRRAVVLRVVHELPYIEIADELQCTQTNARLRVSRGLQALRAHTKRSPTG